MTFFRTRLSAAIAWAMIPMAAWAGMPSTACVCANGRLKLFCQHVLGTKQAAGESDCASNCCGQEEGDHDADCCGGGFCCHGNNSGPSGIGSKTCCKPILNAPSASPQVVSVPCDQTPAIVADVPEMDTLVHSSLILDAAEFNTGPPLDRVIVFRSLLI